ncbi:MAG: hypothetical protein ACE5Q6_17730, partial [Dehalococcoidia bacterium]
FDRPVLSLPKGSPRAVRTWGPLVLSLSKDALRQFDTPTKDSQLGVEERFNVPTSLQNSNDFHSITHRTEEDHEAMKGQTS